MIMWRCHQPVDAKMKFTENCLRRWKGPSGLNWQKEGRWRLGAWAIWVQLTTTLSKLVAKLFHQRPSSRKASAPFLITSTLTLTKTSWLCNDSRKNTKEREWAQENTISLNKTTNFTNFSSLDPPNKGNSCDQQRHFICSLIDFFNQ